MQAVGVVVDHLKTLSKQVTTPEEIAQVWYLYGGLVTNG
jgi:hypothetical protein